MYGVATQLTCIYKVCQVRHCVVTVICCTGTDCFTIQTSSYHHLPCNVLVSQLSRFIIHSLVHDNNFYFVRMVFKTFYLLLIICELILVYIVTILNKSLKLMILYTFYRMLKNKCYINVFVGSSMDSRSSCHYVSVLHC